MTPMDEKQARILADFEALDAERRQELVDEATRLLREQREEAKA